VKKNLVLISILVLISFSTWGQSVKTEKLYSGRMEGLHLQEALYYMENLTGLKFAYSAMLIGNNPAIHFEFKDMPVMQVIEGFCENGGLKFTVFGSQILLKSVPINSKFILKGKIMENGSDIAVPYAGIYLKSSLKGSISDINGEFEIGISEENGPDTIVISSMGFVSSTIAVSDVKDKRYIEIYLVPNVYEIQPIKILSRSFKKMCLGNRSNIPTGSLYLDTHGQQAAMFIENDRKFSGKILMLNYYLSPRGNTEAPFRVRLYKKDTVKGGPGEDMVPAILVVKPDIRKGWYSVDVRDYNIDIPENGFFIAMEGVYPNDYGFYIRDAGFIDLTQADEIDVPEDEEYASINYGQRLGYTRNKKDKNNTWHYSLSHTWFQLKRQPFGLMVSADVQVKKNKN
jgi:hypothetical protein